MTQRPFTPFVMSGLYPWEEVAGEAFKLWVSFSFAGLRFWTRGVFNPFDLGANRIY